MKRSGSNYILIKCLISFVIFVIVSTLFKTSYLYASNVSGSVFQIDFIDVGQGDASLVQCDNHYMLVDGGDSDQSSRIYSILKNRSVNHLDVIVATHPDADHIGGLSGALNYASADVAFSPVTEHDTKTFKSFVKYLGKRGITITVPKAGDEFELGTAKVTILGPRTISSETNNNSIVLRIVYGDTSFLLTGDAETDEENDILCSGQKLQSTVLKVGHHGSKYSSGYRFVREVSPEYAVISVGSDNSYGHPTEEVLSRLRDAEVKTYRTDIQGDITCKSDGKTVYFSTKKNENVDTLAGAGLGRNSAIQVKDSNEDIHSANKDLNVVVPAASEIVTDQVEETYVLNTNTHKFHYPSCGSVSKMKDKNKRVYTGTREAVISQGFDPCKNCKP